MKFGNNFLLWILCNDVGIHTAINQTFLWRLNHKICFPQRLKINVFLWFFPPNKGAACCCAWVIVKKKKKLIKVDVSHLSIHGNTCTHICFCAIFPFLEHYGLSSDPPHVVAAWARFPSTCPMGANSIPQSKYENKKCIPFFAGFFFKKKLYRACDLMTRI